MTWWASRRRPKRREATKASPSTAGAKLDHDPQGRLRRRCAVAAQALTVAAGLGREIASGRETYKGSAPPLASNRKRIRLSLPLQAADHRRHPWEPAGRPCSLVSPLACLAALKAYSARFFRVSRLFPQHPLLSRFLFDPPEASGRKSGALSAPTPSSRHGAQGPSGMPKAPRSGGSRRRTSLTVQSTVALAFCERCETEVINKPLH